NLQFRNNAGDVLSVTNSGAVFQDADTLKSPVPPFTTTARPRNAERNPVGQVQGTGSSTFVVEADALLPGTNNFTTVLSDSNSAALLIPVTPDTGAFPYVWQSVPVGSLFP